MSTSGELVVPPPSNHEYLWGVGVLGEDDYCSGYMDPFGKWNNGFPCPALEEGQPVYCCGTESLKYCCINPRIAPAHHVPNLTLMLGIVFGIAVSIAVAIVVSCFHCSCCLFYKKRQPRTTEGSIYRMHCSSTATTGVANMYSFSESTTPSDTPRTPSRASSSSRSHFTAESRPSTISYAPCDIPEPEIHQGDPRFRFNENGSRPGSLVHCIDHSLSTLSDATVLEVPPSLGGRWSTDPHFEPPPPYTPQSTLVAVRTASSHYGVPSYQQFASPLGEQPTNQELLLPERPIIIPARNSLPPGSFFSSVGVVTEGAAGTPTGSLLRTFSQDGVSHSASSSAAIAALAAATRLNTLRSHKLHSVHSFMDQHNSDPDEEHKSRPTVYSLDRWRQHCQYMRRDYPDHTYANIENNVGLDDSPPLQSYNSINNDSENVATVNCFEIFGPRLQPVNDYDNYKMPINNVKYCQIPAPFVVSKDSLLPDLSSCNGPIHFNYEDGSSPESNCPIQKTLNYTESG